MASDALCLQSEGSPLEKNLVTSPSLLKTSQTPSDEDHPHPLALIGNSSRPKALPTNIASLAAPPTQVVSLLHPCEMGIIIDPTLNEIACMEFFVDAGHTVPR